MYYWNKSSRVYIPVTIDYTLKDLKMTEAFIQFAIVLVGTGAFWSYLNSKDQQRQAAHEALTSRLM